MYMCKIYILITCFIDLHSFAPSEIHHSRSLHVTGPCSPLKKPGEDDEVASENVAVAIPRISISAPALKIPKVEDPKDPKDSGPSVPSTRKPGDLLKEQLGHAQNGMTFADGVRIEAAQKVLLVTFFSR